MCERGKNGRGRAEELGFTAGGSARVPDSPWALGQRTALSMERSVPPAPEAKGLKESTGETLACLQSPHHRFPDTEGLG